MTDSPAPSRLTIALLLLVLTGCSGGGGLGSVGPAGGDEYRLSAPLTDFLDYRLVLTGADGPGQAGGFDPEVITLDRAMAVLADYDVVFVGEAHGHAGNHALQMDIFRRMHAQSPELSLSMEQFERDTQAVLDAYLAGEIGEAPLRSDARAWDHYRQSYRPLVEFAKLNALPVIAAEVPTSIVRCIGDMGPEVLNELSPEERSWAARELHLDESAYRDKFLGFLRSSMSHGGPPADEDAPPTEQNLRSYAAQVSRDDTMAESIALHLEEHPGRRVMHITGSFHSEGFLGTVERLQMRRPDLRIAVVSPVLVDDPDAPAFDRVELGAGTILALLHPTPPDWVDQERMMDFMRSTAGAIRRSACELVG